MRTLGQIFRETRESKGLTASQSAEATRIIPQMLNRMEADLWDRMPAPIYARGFIKMYAELLALPPEPLIEAYNRWARTDRKQPPFIDEGGNEREADPVPESPLPRIEELPVAAPPAPVAVQRPVEIPRPVAEAPAPPPPRPRPRPALTPLNRPALAGMGQLLKYLPIGLVMVLALVLVFSAMKRWGHFSRSPTPDTPDNAEAQANSSTHPAVAPAFGEEASGLRLAENPPATYFDDTP